MIDRPHIPASSYGTVTKTFHWLTALLILTEFPLGLYANGLPFSTGDELARAGFFFSLHKSLGVTIFFVALARVAWALLRPRPGPLYPDRRLESFLAMTVHWALYVALVTVPLTGWISHAATSGFAPTYWPFGQSLPFVPKNEIVAEVFAGLHIVFGRVLAISILVHIAGALKHLLSDRNATFGRMWFTSRSAPTAPPSQPGIPPPAAAFTVYAVALALGANSGVFESTSSPQAPSATHTTPASGWVVRDGTIAITVQQLGNNLSGHFDDWTASIEFDQATGIGSVEVTINIASLALGSVTAHALGPEFFNASTYPTAKFAARVAPDGPRHAATGALSLRGIEAPVTLPFELSLDDGAATMSGATTIDRRNFGIGKSFPDEKSVGFTVSVDVSLSAIRPD